MIQVFQRGGYKRDELIMDAATFYLKKYLSPRLFNSLSIRIEMRATKLSKNTHGSAMLPKNGSKATRCIRVIIDRDLSNTNLLVTLAHEMVHVVQAVKNRLQYTKKPEGTLVRWEGKVLGFFHTIPYMEQPWEKEAFALQENLAFSYLMSQKKVERN